ncbi:MAG: type II toxin-antitoxin system RelE/ParE family toxin [Methylacidiphilales bacterium]|nr:type II toxin-antitoxin system RelE/ParE family toxin [Candidatus Methylacidiphilales bacterium]
MHPNDQKKITKKLKFAPQIKRINMTSNPLPVSRSLRVSTPASNRIEEIRSWYEENYGEEMADDFYETILDKFDLLERFNEAGPEVPDRPGVRRLVIIGRFEFYAFYRLTETEVVVLAVTKDAEPRLED